MKRFSVIVLVVLVFLMGGIVGARAFSVTETVTEYIEKPVEIIQYVEVPVEVIEYIEVETPKKTAETKATNVPSWSEDDAVMLAKVVIGEAGSIGSDMEKAAVVWCILNRVDAEGYAFGKSIEHVVTYPNQFLGYRESLTVDAETLALVKDVLTRWDEEKAGETNVGRVLPKDYLWFHGDGRHNHFRNAYQGGIRWDWSLPNPYET